MGTPLRVLIVENPEDDTLSTVRELQHSGYDPTFERVETPEAMSTALAQQTWDIIIADYPMPRFDGLAALRLLQESGLDLPFILVSGAIGEETAVAAMKAGAHDYITKGNLARLIPAIERELREAEVRRQRKRAEEVYRALVENSLQGLAILQGDSIVFANPTVTQMLGYTVEELLSLSPEEWKAVLHPDDQAFVLGRYRDRLQGKPIPPRYEFRMMRKDRTVCWVEMSSRRIEYDGKPAIQATLVDITERKRAEETLRRLETAVIQSIDGIAVADLDGNIQFVNPTWAQMHGYRVDDLQHKHLSIFHTEKQMQRDVIPFNEQVKNTGAHQGEVGHVRKDGATFPTWMTTTLLRDEEGNPIGFVGIARDITERKGVEEALRESEEKFRSLAEQSPNMIFINKKGRVVYANKKCEEIMGYKRKEFYSPDFNFLTLIAPESTDLVKANFNRHMKGEEVPPCEYALITKEGKRIAALYATKLIRYEGESAILGTVTDITERKQAEEALRERATRLELIARVSQRTTAILELDELLHQAVKLISDAFEYYNVIILLVDGSEIVLRAATLPSLRPLEGRVRLRVGSEGITGWVARSGEPLLVPDVSLEARYHAVLEEMETKSELAVPIKLKGRVIGVLDAQSAERHAFSQADVFTLQAIADQLAIAIENAQLYEAEAQRRREAETLRQASAALTSTLDLEKTLDLILEQLHHMVAYDSASVQLLRDDHLEIVGRRSFANPSAIIGLCFPVPGDNPNTRVIESGEPLILADAHAAHAPFRDPPHDHIRSWLGVPMRFRERTIGMITLDSTELGHFTADHARLAAAFANQATVAIENARIYEEERKRVTQLELIGEITQRIASILDLDELLPQVAHLIGSTFGYYHTSILLVEADSDELIMKAGTGPLGETLVNRLRFKIGQEGITGWVAHSGEPLLVNDVSGEPRHYSTEESKDTRSELAVPIKLKREIIGVLDVQSVELDAFGEDDIFILQTLADQLAIAIENARLYEEVHANSRYLETLQRINATLRSTLPLSQVLETIARGAGEALNYVGSLILIPDTTGERLILGAVWGSRFLDAAVKLTGLEVASFSLPLTAEENPIARAYLSRELQAWSRTPERIIVGVEPAISPKLAPVIERAMGARSAACIPLPIGEKMVGVLIVFSPQEQFSEEERAMLLGLADQAGLAIENARLYQETVRRLEEAEALGAVTTALTRSLDLDQVLQSIVDSATRLIPASTSGVIHLADEMAGKLIPRATSTPGVNVQKSMEMPIGKGIAGLVMQEKRLINVPNVEKDPRFLPLDTGTFKKSLLTAPLLIDGDCIGTLSLNSDQVGAFSADDERLLTTLAAQATIAVRNAGLHQKVQRQVEELIFFNQIGRTVTSSLDLEQILATVMEETALVLKTEAGSILLLDEESSELVFEATVGPRSEEVKGLRVPLGQGIAGWVAREGQRLLVPDVRKDPRFYSVIDGATGFATKSVLAIPLKVKGKVIGVIEAVNKIEGYFGQADVALLSSMAQWAAIAIENAQLFAETQRRFEEMAALHDTSLDITARLEMPELLKSIVERAVGLLRADAGGIYLYDQERKVLRLAIGYEYTEKHVGATLKPGEGMAGKVFQTGEPLIVDDYRTWEGRATVFETDQPFTAALEVPLKWQERIIGVLAINADMQKRTFNQEDVWLVTLFANQAVIAIENARLYKELQNRMGELKRTQDQLIQSAKLAAIGRLAAGVAHEINNPLTSIMGFTRLLLQGVDDDDPMKEDLQIIDREAARTKAIVRGLLDFARQREPQLESVDVNEIVRTTMTLVRHQVKGTRVTIKESYDETLPPVSLDADQIKQVFLNMMTNAIQAMPEGGELKVVTAYEGMDGADCVAVEFHDTGTGISAEDLPRIFDPFFTTKEVGQGTGLGLSISQGIVERHGGKIEVKSEVGRGSIFTVLLPVAEERRATSLPSVVEGSPKRG